MAQALYMDVNIPAAISSALHRRQFDVLTCQEDGTREWNDERLLERCCETGRIFVTHDQDLLRIATR